jgi:hypothetical protein
MRISKIALVAAAMVVSAGSLQAQTVTNCNEGTQAGMQGTTCQTTTDLSATVPYLAVITKNITSATLPAATVANMNGYSDAVAGPTLNIKANFVWTLTATTAGFAQVTAQNVSYTKASADLEISNTASGTDWTQMSSSRVLATAGSAATATQDVVTRYRVAYSWAKDLPGSYSAQVTYTLTAP